MKKQIQMMSYAIKINYGNGFEYVSSITLNLYDTPKEKRKIIKELKDKYNVTGIYSINISNFFNVYY